MWDFPITSHSSELSWDNSGHSSPSSPVGQYCISVQSVSSVTQLCLTLCNSMDCSTPGFPVHHQLLELAQTFVYRVGDAIQPSHPLLSPSPPAFNLFQHQSLFPVSQLFSSRGQTPNSHWSFSFSISPSNEYSGLISFRMDWLDLLAVQGTLKSFIQQHNSKASTVGSKNESYKSKKRTKIFNKWKSDKSKIYLRITLEMLWAVWGQFSVRYFLLNCTCSQSL